MLAPAAALNVAVVAPAATVTDPATVSRALLLPSVTVVPPVGGACPNVTVHVLTPLGPNIAGLHPIPDTCTVPPKLMVAVCKLPPSVAVTVALCALPMLPAALTLKLAVVAPAATVTDAGPLSAIAVVAVSVFVMLYVKSAVTEPSVCVPCSDVPANPVWFPNVHVGLLPVPAV